MIQKTFGFNEIKPQLIPRQAWSLSFKGYINANVYEYRRQTLEQQFFETIAGEIAGIPRDMC